MTRQSKQGKTGTPIRIHIHISSFRQPTLVLVLASWDLEGETSLWSHLDWFLAPKWNQVGTKMLPKKWIFAPKYYLGRLWGGLGTLGGGGAVKNGTGGGGIFRLWWFGELKCGLSGTSWRLDRRLGPSWARLWPSWWPKKSIPKSIVVSMPLGIVFF